jgi:hypothetical protein
MFDPRKLGLQSSEFAEIAVSKSTPLYFGPICSESYSDWEMLDADTRLIVVSA